MNCTFCGKKLYPEAPFCPHCGKPNTQQTKLEEDVRAFEEGYRQTTAAVKTAVRRKNRYLAKITIIVFLIVGIGFSIFLHMAADGIARDLRLSQIKKNLPSILQTEDTYLEAQDYFGLRSYLAFNNTSRYIDTAAPAYHMVNQVTPYYCSLMERIMQYCEQVRTENTDRSASRLADTCRYIRNDLDSFYTYTRQDPSSWYGEQMHLENVSQMRENLEAVLCAAFDIPGEIVRSWPELSQGERGVLMERYIRPVEAPGGEE